MVSIMTIVGMSRVNINIITIEIIANSKKIVSTANKKKRIIDLKMLFLDITKTDQGS